MGKGVLKSEEFGGGNGAGNMQTKQLKRQLEVTQEDLYKMEKVNSLIGSIKGQLLYNVIYKDIISAKTFKINDDIFDDILGKRCANRQN